ncbi:NADH dehydrogenase 1 alpha subcomplex subunit 10, mitochondrial, partial [Eumeta japonica]
QYLKEIASHAELLIYDWTAGGETEVVVEDIERIDFERFEKDPDEKKLKDWRFPNEGEWCDARFNYTYGKSDLMNYFNVPRSMCPNYCVMLRAAKFGVMFGSGMKYRHGYNEDMGDTGIPPKPKLI